MIPLRLQSTDAGAPVLSQTAGSLIALLDVFLVTNLGWTKEYAGTNKAVYRNTSVVTESYLQVDDTATTVARVRAYSTMSDVDTGTGAFPTTAIEASFYWLKGSWGYDLIGTDKCFYYAVYATSNLSVQHLYFFGDFISTNTVNYTNSLLVGTDSTSSGVTNNPFNNVNNEFYVKSLPDLTNFSYRCMLNPANSSINVSNLVPYPDTMTGGHAMSTVSVYSAIANKQGEHGILPGMLFSNNVLSTQGIIANDTFLDIDGYTLLVTRSRGQTAPTSTSAWRAIYIDKDWDLV